MINFQNNFYNNSDATNTNAGTEDNGVGSFTYVNFISNIFFAKSYHEHSPSLLKL